MTESAIVSNILLQLKLICNRYGYFWRSSNHGVFLGNSQNGRRYMFHGEKGVGDIIGLLNNGKFISIEVKTPKAYKMKNHNLSDHQMNFMNKIIAMNGIAICVCNFQDVYKCIIKELNNENNKC